MSSVGGKTDHTEKNSFMQNLDFFKMGLGGLTPYNFTSLQIMETRRSVDMQ